MRLVRLVPNGSVSAMLVPVMVPSTPRTVKRVMSFAPFLATVTVTA